MQMIDDWSEKKENCRLLFCVNTQYITGFGCRWYFSVHFAECKIGFRPFPAARATIDALCLLFAKTLPPDLTIETAFEKEIPLPGIKTSRLSFILT